MDRKPSALMFATVMLVAGCASQGLRLATAPSAEGPADFLVDVNGEKFVLRLIAAEQIAVARARASGTQPQGIVSGTLIEGDGGFNRDVAADRMWTWHLDPRSISFPQVAMELCDGRPSDVKRDRAHWINDVKRFCPWGAKIERELSGGGAWRYDQDFTKPSGWDDEHDGCKVRWCADKDWNSKAGSRCG